MLLGQMHDVIFCFLLPLFSFKNGSKRLVIKTRIVDVMKQNACLVFNLELIILLLSLTAFHCIGPQTQ